MPEPVISPWVIPAAKIALDPNTRNAVQKAWHSTLNALLGRQSTIAFTGMSGIGKTVLFDHLTGEAYRPGYQPPDESQKVDRGQVGSTISPEKRRIKMKVIPGADSEPRLLAINDIFYGGKPVDGFVHVVAYGYRAIRNPIARKRLIEQDNLETLTAFRTYQLEEEIRDLARTCAFVRQSIKKHRTPRWMVVAATKADLYPDQIREAETYYSPDGDSEFVELLRIFAGQVGSDNFRWAALPVCTYLTDFEWNTDTAESTVKPGQRDTMLLSFGEALHSYCSSYD